MFPVYYSRDSDLEAYHEAKESYDNSETKYEIIWTEDVEKAFIRAAIRLAEFPSNLSIVDPITNRRFIVGRNELISRIIFARTKTYRKVKQISSHIETWKKESKGKSSKEARKISEYFKKYYSAKTIVENNNMGYTENNIHRAGDGISEGSKRKNTDENRNPVKRIRNGKPRKGNAERAIELFHPNKPLNIQHMPTTGANNKIIQETKCLPLNRKIRNTRDKNVGYGITPKVDQSDFNRAINCVITEENIGEVQNSLAKNNVGEQDIDALIGEILNDLEAKGNAKDSTDMMEKQTIDTAKGYSCKEAVKENSSLNQVGLAEERLEYEWEHIMSSSRLVEYLEDMLAKAETINMEYLMKERVDSEQTKDTKDTLKRNKESSCEFIDKQSKTQNNCQL
ncbi:hypothetical protein BB559_002184 [Furculomyces boomerangus]|uniref:TEA domain-containing protein n=2 Tax=Harpellales TaxID=61421 RepID=A0A2T9YX91_9FUNG|nr:hypothetical protein BB559_002184 [Furculomyces boomerangus]PWA02048.1 hypothetical protein BB558_001821 [Smittium angustum]